MPLYPGSTEISEVTGLQNALDAKASLTGSGAFYWTFSMSHSSTSNTGTADATFFYGNPLNLSAVVSSANRGFAFPYAGTIIAAVSTATFTSGGTGTQTATTPSVSIQNREQSQFSDLLIAHSYSTVNVPDIKRSTGLNIAINGTDTYNFRIVVPGFSTANASALQHHITLYIRPS